MTTTRQKVLAIVKRDGLYLEEADFDMASYVEVFAPFGHRFKVPELHSVIGRWMPGLIKKEEAWQSVLDDIVGGVERCVPGQCDICDSESVQEEPK